MPENNNRGLTHCNEQINCFLGTIKFRETRDHRPVAMIQVSWGINDLPRLQFASWRNCIVYDRSAENLQNVKPGAYLDLSGWLTTNPVYGKDGKIVYVSDKPLTKQFLVVDNLFIIPRNNQTLAKQLPLVETPA